jgi:hypothetical protein
VQLAALALPAHPAALRWRSRGGGGAAGRRTRGRPGRVAVRALSCGDAGARLGEQLRVALQRCSCAASHQSVISAKRRSPSSFARKCTSRRSRSAVDLARRRAAASARRPACAVAGGTPSFELQLREFALRPVEPGTTSAVHERYRQLGGGDQGEQTPRGRARRRVRPHPTGEADSGIASTPSGARGMMPPR